MQTAISLSHLCLPCAILIFISGVIATENSLSKDEAPQCQQGQCREGPDAMSLMQGANVRLDLLGTGDVSRSLKQTGAVISGGSASAQVSEGEEVSLFSAAPVVKGKAGRQALTSSVLAKAKAGMSLLVVHAQTKSGMGLMLVFVLVLGCLFIFCSASLFSNVRSDTGKTGGSRSTPEAMPIVPSQGAFAERHSVAGREHSRESPVVPQGSPSSAWPGQPPSFSFSAQRPSMSAFSDRGLAQPLASGLQGLPSTSIVRGDGDLAVPQWPQQPAQMLAPVSAPPAPFSPKAPPALCPTLVMPVCEARFGVPMHELAQFGTEGTINIVGLSGNPLLKAGIRNDGNGQRTLEIRMPEKNSAPRAAIVPCAQGDFEICGMKGVFYGMLRLRKTGACYVIKDGMTILVLDGDTEQLRLSVRSGSGSQLASVMCSAEPFGGVEHVEIRVEPGVDTVLVLAVVLGVLLLSDR